MRGTNEKESDNYFIQEELIPSPIRPNYNFEYEDSPNTNIITTENDNLKNKKIITKSKASSSYQNLIKTKKKCK